MLLQLGNFLHPDIIGLSAVRQTVVFPDCGIAGRFQIRIGQQATLMQKTQRLCHLFQIEHAGPPLKSRRVRLLHFQLDVDQQIGSSPLSL